MDDGRRRAVFLVSAAFFVVVFGALSVAALATAELSISTIVLGAITLFVLGAVVTAMVEAYRNKPGG